MDRTPDVVVVGSACRDIVEDDARGWRLGGGASYSALTLARLGLRVGAIVVADKLAAASTELGMVRDAGVAVVVVPGARGPVFINVETPTGRVQQTPQVSDPVDPRALPDTWRRSGAWMLVPVAAEVTEDWADVPPADAVVAVGWQGLLRVLTPGAQVGHLPPSSTRVVRRADLIGVGRDDIDASITTADLAGLLRPSATMLLTNGIHGGDAIEIGRGGVIAATRHWHSIPIQRYVDPVGAGDTFLAGVFAARVKPAIASSWKGPDPDLRMGAAVGSLILEGPGLYGVPEHAAAVRRMHDGDNPD